MDKKKKTVPNFKTAFKSTLLKVPQSNISEAEKRSNLLKQLELVNMEIAELKHEGCNESELQTHIEKLHEYNEVKDVGQMVLGRLATLKGKRTRDLYEEYGLDLED